jgi:hypothetical protein
MATCSARFATVTMLAGLAASAACDDTREPAKPDGESEDIDEAVQHDDDAVHHDDEGEMNAGHADPLLHCRMGYPPDPRDEQLSGEPLVVEMPDGSRDLLVPQLVLDWMAEHAWEQSHDDWHNVRNWDSGCRLSNAPAEGCPSAQRLLAQGLWRAPIQARAPGDGYAFLVMHRHMIQALKQAFPKHAALFSSLKHIPRRQDDPENPTPWREITWTSGQLAALEILENIEDNLDRFPSEDELGLYMQGATRWTPENVSVDTGEKTAGIHGALHFQWAVAGSPGDLGRQTINNRNLIFYKFHGWMDDVWERYRRANGIDENDPDYLEELFNQCKEMHDLDLRNRPIPDGADMLAPPPEFGFFVRNVRPILEKNCAGCHGAAAAEANLVLGGMGRLNADIIAHIVGVKASNGEYDLVLPGNPDKSWLYLKISGGAAAAACSGDCNRQRMPAGMALTEDEIVFVRQWILQGAPLPQQ